ncbi:uncharacterized protein BDZ99DRAFT_503170 [Mytilinidion resinicola]|uniref:Uncharacterized protein n=1 Tax=Mytilinidion resinicola TaxID=574789 RepID=A0A6A6Y4G5_9PEZI|nr:uncharacterized protein BDZ99DRAFT_503170 [Mytilinidion resinicola]KAF2803550.1 hypothetical protein BDZ99DRAFT_503170 [Mytilinidion resinicola]
MTAAAVLHQAVLRFGVPDTSISVEERGLYAFPANKDVEEFDFQLRDARTSPEILPGMAGLDAQGFAFVKHKSALQDSKDWLTGHNVEKTYIPEIEKLACEVTGGKRAVVMDASFRLKPADDQIQLDWYRRRGDAIDDQVALLPKNVTAVYGREVGAAIEPARQAHIDYTCQGMRDTARYRRQDIYDMCKKTMEAEDAVARGEKHSKEVPRYAAFSAWRPLSTVRRDPIAVCDSRSVKADDYAKVLYRAVSDITGSREYHLEAAWLSPPGEKSD